MVIPGIPKDEKARLQTLHSLAILDTKPEERFDRITRMAKRLFEVPIALVSLVDENRQWFKSCVGLDASETSRDVSFCGHAILGNEVFVIPDAKEDERFSDNPLVTDAPFIRFYAGCPLKAPDGSKLGTLCIIDQSPREMSQEDIEALEDLASMVEHELAAIKMATMDELTNIANRRGFMLLAQHSLHICKREDIPAALIFIDLDHFKPINDAFGHHEGDHVLASFANELNNNFRNSDVIARLGGDEFAILLTNFTRLCTNEHVHRLHAAIDKINENSALDYTISFSHGVVQFDADRHNTIEALLEDGDQVMYESKRGKQAVGF